MPNVRIGALRVRLGNTKRICSNRVAEGHRISTVRQGADSASVAHKCALPHVRVVLADR